MLNMVGAYRQYQLGVFWALFVPTICACNDSFAFIFGKTFGRTPLIKLSPNKTVEGFLGGAFATFVLVYCVTSFFFDFEKLVCVNYRLDKLPFEQIECLTDQSDVFGQTAEEAGSRLTPALVTCITFGFFASLVSPFAGFFASGMKRAYELKDFANSLPGHGGFLDRFDCTIFANIFALGILSQILYKEYLEMDSLAHLFDDLKPN